MDSPQIGGSAGTTGVPHALAITSRRSPKELRWSMRPVPKRISNAQLRDMAPDLASKLELIVLQHELDAMRFTFAVHNVDGNDEIHIDLRPHHILVMRPNNIVIGGTRSWSAFSTLDYNIYRDRARVNPYIYWCHTHIVDKRTGETVPRTEHTPMPNNLEGVVRDAIKAARTVTPLRLHLFRKPKDKPDLDSERCSDES